MALLNFQSQLGPVVQSGWKCQTIRAKRKHPVKVGEPLYLYTGLRTKAAERLVDPVPCTHAREIVIRKVDNKIVNVQVQVDGRTLTIEEMESLAVLDGFRSLIEFWQFFLSDENPLFEGQLIQWRLPNGVVPDRRWMFADEGTPKKLAGEGDTTMEVGHTRKGDKYWKFKGGA